MKLVTLATMSAALLASTAAPGQVTHPQQNNHAPAARPSYTTHPGARGFVHNPVWRSPAHYPARGHGHYHFHFHGHSYVVLAGPIFVAPYYYPFVSTPYYPASFYGPEDQGYFLYYCPSPAGYYPDVVDCPAGWWQTVPDDPPQMGPYYN